MIYYTSLYSLLQEPGESSYAYTHELYRSVPCRAPWVECSNHSFAYSPVTGHRVLDFDDDLDVVVVVVVVVGVMEEEA